MAATDLNPRQKKFCDEYLISLNATDACIKAGYSLKTARYMGYENLTKPHIQGYLQARLKVLATKTGITQERIINEIASIALLNITDICNIDKDGSVTVKSLGDIPEEARAAIKEVTTFQLPDGNGMAYKIQFWDKVKGLEMLAKYFGMFIERKEIGAPGEFDKLSDDELDNRIKQAEAEFFGASQGAKKKKGKPLPDRLH